jgi:TetR/AcrR family transcriptional regulator
MERSRTNRTTGATGTAQESQAPRRAGRPVKPVAREDLLRTAVEAFSESGYGATSLEVIASRAGLRKSSLLHHFASKEELYRAALAGSLGAFGGMVSAARLGEGAFSERLDRLSETMVRYLAARPEAARLLLREVMDNGPFVRGAGRQALRAAFDAVADFLAAGMSAGAFADQDPRQLALTIVGLPLLYFAIDDVASDFLRVESRAPKAVVRRVEAVKEHVRQLCLAKSS